MDRLVNERVDVRRSITSIRSTGSKLVTFEDEHQRKKHAAPIYDNTKKDQHRFQPPPSTTTVQSKSKYDDSRPTIINNSDEDVTISNANESDDDEDTQPTQPGVMTGIQPQPRKNPPPSKATQGVSALVVGGIKSSTTSGGTTISDIARQPVVKAKRTTERFSSDR